MLECYQHRVLRISPDADGLHPGTTTSFQHSSIPRWDPFFRMETYRLEPRPTRDDRPAGFPPSRAHHERNQ